MRVELLKDVVHSIIGEKSKGIVDLLFTKKNVNEFIIAKKLGLTINQTRNLLYKLVDEGLVSVTRKKNRKKGGWYDHFWTLNLEKSLAKLQENISKKIESLKSQVGTKKNTRFYFCELCGVELNEEQALLQEYTCTECGQLFVLKDNSKDIASLEKEIVKLEKEILEVNEEISLLSQKNAKSREKRMRIEDKKKSDERTAKRKAAKRLRDKNNPKKIKKKEFKHSSNKFRKHKKK